MQLNIIHEDNSIVVINKPNGLIVNRSHTTKEETLQDLLMQTYGLQVVGELPSVEVEDELEESAFTSRSGIVHRLDKETSGVMVVAKTPQAFDLLQEQFKLRQIKKEYLAVLLGKLPEAVVEVDAPIGRNPNSPMKFAVVSEGKEASTRVESICEFGIEAYTFTLVRVLPKTGRTHQIRVHSSALGLPVALDSLYCTQKQYELCSMYFNRLMLHSYKLTLIHPESGSEVTYTAPVPQEFKELPCDIDFTTI